MLREVKTLDRPSASSPPLPCSSARIAAGDAGRVSASFAFWAAILREAVRRYWAYPTVSPSQLRNSYAR
jgi:hypothetical protein